MEERAKVASLDSKQRLSRPVFYLRDINQPKVQLEKARVNYHELAKRGVHHAGLLPIHKKPNLCGIVLAGGDGKRLQPLVHRLRGDMLPKQFVNFVSTRSMLESTFLRAEKLIPSDRIFTAANWGHLRHPEVRRQISSRPRGSVVMQPDNKDTGPGLLLPLMHLYKSYPESTVVVFPSDHFILEEDLFMNHVYLACRAVKRDPSRLVLLGIEPDTPEPEYGYILPSGKLRSMGDLGVFTISRFTEKPAIDTAQELILRGGLWNTMVMVFRASTLLHLLRRHFSAIYSHFQRIKEAIGSPFEKAVLQETYRGMEPVNFSRDLLQLFTLRQLSRFLVVPVRGVFWSDWGSEYRVTDTLKKIRYLEKSPRGFKEKLIDTGVGLRTGVLGGEQVQDPGQKQIGEEQAELQEVRRVGAYKDERRHTMKCKRCLRDRESHFRVYTDALDIMVCASCADEARRIGLPVEVFDSKVGSLPAVIIGGRRILEKSSVQRLC